MYIKRLILKAWGTYTDRDLELSDRPGGLVVVHGDNGTGKTTALEAVRGLLFGIPNNTKGNHIHSAKDFRIEGTLVPPTGAELSIVRRKGTRNTLHNSAGEVLTEDTLRPLVGGLDRDSHAVTFALDHERLRAGGNRLSSGDDPLAASLFGASLGAGVHEVHKALIAEAETLFKPGGSKPELNRAIKTFKDKRKEQNELSVKTSDWLRAEKELDEAQGEAREVALALGKLEAQISDLERIEKLAPIVSELREVVLQRDALGEVSQLDDDATQRRIDAERTIREAASKEERLQDRRSKLDASLGLLEVPAQLLEQSATITELYEQVEARKEDAATRVELDGKRLRKKGEAEAALKQIGWACTVEEAKAKLPDGPKISLVRSLAGQHEPLVVDLKAKQRALTEVEQELVVNGARAAQLGSHANLTALETLLDENREQGNPVKQRSELQDAIASREDEVAAELASHRPFEGDSAELSVLSVPAADVIEGYIQRFDAIARQREGLERQIEENRAQGVARAQERAVLTSQGVVATEEQLRDARARRSDGWTLVKGALAGQSQSSEEEQYDAERPLTTAYEHAVDEADDVSDILRREADRSARFLQLSNDHSAAEDDIAHFDSELASLAQVQASAATAWAAEWTVSGLNPKEPSLMATWLLRHDVLIQRVLSLRTLERRRDGLLQQESSLTSRLAAALGAASAEAEAAAGADSREGSEPSAAVGPEVEAADLATLLSRAQGLVKTNQQQEGERTQLAASRMGLDAKKATATRELGLAAAALAEWATAWADGVGEAHLVASTEPAAADALLEAIACFAAAANDVDHYGNRIAQKEKAERTFAEDVAVLVASVAPELAKLAPSAAARAMNERLATARSNAKEVKVLTDRRDEVQEELEQELRDRESATATLAELTEAAGCAEASELPDAERRADSARRLDAERVSLRKQISRESSSRTVEELLDDVAQIELTEVKAELVGLTAERGLKEERANAAQKRVGTLEEVLRSFDTSGRAAEAAEAAESARAKVLELREQYIRKHLAAALLKAAIDRFRDEHQGPLMTRGSEIFAILSLGTFSGLTTGYSASDDPILHCVHLDGHEVTPDKLSEGERDQLYLALRVASLEHFLAKGSPIPLVVDDVLVNFDDKRARAAIEVLAHLSLTTQVLLFTHHATIRDLAKDAVPAERLRVVEL
jgi:uncharacterized protein YhaN